MQHALRVDATPTAGRRSAAPRPLTTIAVLLAADVIALGIAVGVGAWLAELVGGLPLGLQAVHAGVLVFALLLAFGLGDLYPGAGVSPVDEMRTQVLAITGLAVVVSVAIVIGGRPHLAHQVPIIGAWITALVLTTGLRLMLREIWSDEPWWGVPAVVLGAGKSAALVIDRLKRRPFLNVKVVACLDDDPAKHGSEVAGVTVRGALEPGVAQLRRDGVDYAIVAMPGLPPDRLSVLVQKLGRLYSKVVVIPNAFGMTSVGVGTRDSGGIVGLYVRGHLSLRRNRVLKRALDLLLLVPLGLVSLPLIAVSAIGVMVFSPGNPFFAQEREGLGGKRFKVWKLRTMHRDAEAILARHLEKNPEARAEWQTRFKLAKDPRIIPVVGTVLRRLSLDELPQVVNILAGDLSFVGPRPFPYYHLDAFEDEFRTLRSSVPPGLTGYWQVMARATADIQAQVELDTYYITNWSPWLDLYVLARTPWAVLFGDGAY